MDKWYLGGRYKCKEYLKTIKKLLNKTELCILRKFVNRKDYRNALLKNKKNNKNYRITMLRKGLVYVI